MGKKTGKTAQKVEPQDDTGVDEARPVPFSLRLASVKSTRQSFARIIRAYGKGLIEREVFRDLVYSLSSFAVLLKMETDGDIDKQLAELQREVDAMKGLREVS